VSARIHAVDVTGGILFAAAVMLLIMFALFDVFDLPLRGPLARLRKRGLFGWVIIVLLFVATIILWVEVLWMEAPMSPMSPPDPNTNNG
jgi:predicted transporter